MLMEVHECCKCGKQFTFDTSKCSQMIIKNGQSESSIVFLPKCPDCLSINEVELPWEKYGVIDY